MEYSFVIRAAGDTISYPHLFESQGNIPFNLLFIHGFPCAWMSTGARGRNRVETVLQQTITSIHEHVFPEPDILLYSIFSMA